ncbi:MAG: ATP-binding cassette domain-containing protein [Burkholderiales bacterium]|jgi:ABC-2 type transport system ATP-binding protein
MVSSPTEPATAEAARERVLVTRGLCKSYRTGHIIQGRRPALVDLDFELLRGEILGYVGANGSGKTTTFKIFMGLLKPDRGEVSILGEPLASRAWRQRAGYLPEHPYLYDYLTAAEYLDYCGRLFGLAREARRERTRELLSLVGLERSADIPMRRFSKGMLQRAGLAQALVNDPELLFLDEPMSGLDPVGRRLVRDLILAQRQAGKTVLFSTHILSDAETLCDRVAVLRGGRLLSVGPLGELLKLDVTHLELLVSGVGSGAPGLETAQRAEAVGDRLRLLVEEGSLGRVVTAVEAAGGRVLGVQPVRRTLEDYFFEELGGAPQGAAARGAGAWGEG